METIKRGQRKRERMGASLKDRGKQAVQKISAERRRLRRNGAMKCEGRKRYISQQAAPPSVVCIEE